VSGRGRAGRAGGPPPGKAGGGGGEARLQRGARFDRRGRLRLLCWAAPGEPGRCGGNAHLQVHYDDWRGTAGGAAFPHRLELRIPQSGARARLTLRQVELAPEFSPGVFRLSARRKGVSSGREAEK